VRPLRSTTSALRPRLPRGWHADQRLRCRYGMALCEGRVTQASYHTEDIALI
jgi:hypothetical protein